MANENDDLKKALAAKTAECDALKLELASTKGALELAKEMASKGGGAVLLDAKQAQEEARVAKHVAKLNAMRDEAKEIAGPNAKMVKYIVGPSGTVRPSHGVLKHGAVIDVSVDELPAGEWQVWKPGTTEAPAAKSPDTAAAIQRANGPMSAAEKAIAQREALKSQRASDREV